MKIFELSNRVLVRVFSYVVQQSEGKDIDSIENLKNLMATCKKFYSIIDHNLSNGIGIELKGVLGGFRAIWYFSVNSRLLFNRLFLSLFLT